LNAGRDLNLQTVNTSKSFDATLNPENYNRQSQSAEVGSTVQSKGNTTLSAGNNLSARAATVQSGGELSAKAGNNITFEASVASQTDASGRTTEGSSFFASSKSTERQSTSQTQAVGSSFGGNSVTLTSGQDTTIQGSNVLADKDLTIKATGNVTIEAAKNSATSSSYRQTSESGLMSGGGMGFSIGTREQSTDQNDTSTTAAASTVGSVGGNVTITSGKTYTQTGSDVLTPAGNIDITAQTVNITEARETSTSQVDTRFKQQGITVSVSNPVLSAAQSIQNMDKAASQTNSGRMKALAAASAGLAAYSAYTAIDNGMGTMINGKKDQIATGTDSAGKQTSRDSTLIDRAGGFNVNVGIGSSSSESTNRTGSDSARGSSIAAGGNVNIKSTGAGTNSNITIQGANVQAGGETSLQADNKVNLTAAANTTTQTSTNSSSANSVGMGIGTSGWTVNASANKGQGYGDGSDTTYTNTQVKGKAVKITSGGDTNLQGAVVTGSTVKADVGGNLNIETLQDKSTYAETQSSSGFSVSIPIGPGKASGNIHASNTDIKGNYQSANQQSGIQAGGGGFQLAVAGNTDLKGGVIASTDKAIADNKNSLTTGTITTSEVQNHASASATTTGFNAGTSMFTEGAYGQAKGIGANLLDNASQNSSSSGQTRSVVSAGTVTITDEVKQQTTGNTASQTIASLNRDTTNANTVAQRQDVQAMKQSVEAERAIKNEAVRQITTLTDEAYRVMFKEVPKFYKVTCPAGVDCTKNPEKTTTTQVMGSAQEVQAELAKATAGAVLAVNGIDNPLDRAGQLAMQNAEPVRDSSGNEAKPTTIYLMHYVPSNNGLSELLVAGYEKKLAPTLGYSNQDQAYADGLKTLGANTGGDVVSLGHSRGTIVQTNANAILASEGVTKSNLSVQGVGGAVSAEEYTKAAEKVQGPLGNREKITFSYFKNDPIPVGTAGNPGVLSLSEFWKVLSTPNSAHSCYGTGAAGCQQVQILSPNAPGGAVQDNSNLVQYIGGKPYDSNMKPLDLKH
jgi:filamentous hemagglutinin